MSRFLCQSCSTEQDTWSGSCLKCGSNRAIQLEAEDSMVGRKVAGKYKILRKLGQGGMGAVYEAEVEGIGQRVALKFLSNAFQMDSKTAFRFLNEAKGLARLSHPNAVKLMDFAQDEEGRLFFSMEYVEGVDLKKFIGEQGRVSPRDAVQLTVQVADALAHAHSKGVIHRDLKPENIMVRKWAGGLFVTVLDFGLARLVEEGASRLTNTGTLMGSPRYMSPEQAFGKEVDQRTDIYSLGIVLFEMITGTQPFVAEGHMEILQKQREMPMPHLWEVAGDLMLPEVDAVIQKATAKEPNARFVSMEAFAAPLEESSANLGKGPQIRSPLLEQKRSASEAGSPRSPTPAPKTPYPLQSAPPVAREPSRVSHGSHGSQRGLSAPHVEEALHSSDRIGAGLSPARSLRFNVWWVAGGGALLAVVTTAAVLLLRPSPHPLPPPAIQAVDTAPHPPAPVVPPQPPTVAPPVAAPAPPAEATAAPSPPATAVAAHEATPPPIPAPPARRTQASRDRSSGKSSTGRSDKGPKRPPPSKQNGIVDPFGE